MKKINYNKECPLCNGIHDYHLFVYYKDEDEIAFFGAGKKTDKQLYSSNKREVIFQCPKTNEFFANDIFINDIPIEGIIKVESKIYDSSSENNKEIQNSESIHRAKEQIQFPHSSTEILIKDLEDWIKTSMQTARDFCKTMITVSTGAIPIFYTIWATLGKGNSEFNYLTWATLIPSIGFLSASVLFIIAHQPKYYNLEGINIIEFRLYRQKRLKHLNKYIKIATVVFILSVFVSILLFSTKIYMT
ncbi:MAG: hypothetical protein ACKVTZ_10375 [Bacteroidia bacterium]